MMLARLLTIRSVPSQVLVATAAASYGTLILSSIAGWPLWAKVAAAALPWGFVFVAEAAWTYRHFQWLALFYVLVVTQGGHVVEHLVQMIQIHLFDLSGPDARGVFGQLDVEWVHFAWNTWVLVAVVALLSRYRTNRWLWVTLVFAGWHEVEHTVLLTRYLASGIAGDPGLLAEGGAGGGLPVARADLHFLYNLIETAPLFGAFAWQLRRVYDEWLARALPHAGEEAWIDLTNAAESRKFAPGDLIVRQGDRAEHFFVVVRGEVEVVRDDQGGETILDTLGPGQYFGEVGLLHANTRVASVRARTPAEVLSLSRPAFEQLVERSAATVDQLEKAAALRMSPTPTR